MDFMSSFWLGMKISNLTLFHILNYLSLFRIVQFFQHKNHQTWGVLSFLQLIEDHYYYFHCSHRSNPLNNLDLSGNR